MSSRTPLMFVAAAIVLLLVRLVGASSADEIMWVFGFMLAGAGIGGLLRMARRAEQPALTSPDLEERFVRMEEQMLLQDEEIFRLRQRSDFDRDLMGPGASENNGRGE